MTHDRGTVVIASDPFGNTPRRPYLILSGDNHPFGTEQYIALGITTQEYPKRVPLEGSFDVGTLTRESFVSPWAVVSLRNVDVDRAVARVTLEITDFATERMIQYVRS